MSSSNELTSPATSGDDDHDRRSVTIKEGAVPEEQSPSDSPKNESPSLPAKETKTTTYVDIETGGPCQKTCVVMPVNEEIQEAGAATWWKKNNPLMLMGGGSFRLNNTNSHSVRISRSAPSRRNLMANEQDTTSQKKSMRAGSFRRTPDPQQLVEEASIKQYRIVSSRRASPVNSAFGRYYYAAHKHAVSLIHRYIQWTFRTSFSMVTLASFAFFMALIIVFALCIMWADYYQPECIVNGAPDELSHVNFVDAYHLSWTTLSTVGYGLISPGLSSTTGSDAARCTGLNMLMALESFVGVLFASITGAIVFAKIARIQSAAAVVFSDPIVVRYGEGCLDSANDNDNDKDDSTTENSQQRPDQAVLKSHEMPCPVLEFRILNELWNREEGEIMNASVNLVASRLETPDDAEMRLRRLLQQKREREAKEKAKHHKHKKDAHKAGVSLVTETEVTPKVSLMGDSPVVNAGTFFQRVNKAVVNTASAMTHTHKASGGSDKPFNRSKSEEEKHLQSMIHKALGDEIGRIHEAAATATVTVDEGSDDPNVCPKQVFSKLQVETDAHPFFKRIWNIRHVCDQNSPLLPNKIRRMIAKNNGYWPEELNNHEEIRKAINFHEIIVSFSGVANVSGSAVYTQKVYSYIDMAVGYRFANVLLSHEKGDRVLVDTALLNDVTPQCGGGHEPIQQKDMPVFNGYSRTDHDSRSSLRTISENDLESHEEIILTDHPEETEQAENSDGKAEASAVHQV